MTGEISGHPYFYRSVKAWHSVVSACQALRERERVSLASTLNTTRDQGIDLRRLNWRKVGGDANQRVGFRTCYQRPSRRSVHHLNRQSGLLLMFRYSAKSLIV